jgi:ppGpp synthetase/RelA/SpoT-type nucleotidyltranferase
VTLSASAVDRLGERLRRSDVPSAGDADAYREYREEFRPTLRRVEQICDEVLGGLFSTSSGRLKTMESTVAKLKRNRTRLSRVQDIAGFRLTVLNLAIQDHCIRLLSRQLSDAVITDYRELPQGHYRAIHFIVGRSTERFELQIRTENQNSWANTSESLSDELGIEIKYGGGPSAVQDWLGRLSRALAEDDRMKADLFLETAVARAHLGRLALAGGRLTDHQNTFVTAATEQLITRLEAKATKREQDLAELDTLAGQWEKLRNELLRP